MHQYHGVHGVLPPGKKGCCWGTWLVSVLPYVEQTPLYNAWNSCGTNAAGALKTSISTCGLLRRG